MIVYQTNQSGIYTGVTYADPDPLDVGKWLVPAGCVTLPPPSIPFGHVAVYSGGAWSLAEHTDPDTAPDVETEPPTLDQIRATATMTKREFCRKLLALGILPPDEALSAARGDWPATFAAYTAGMDALASADAQIEWAGATSVDYAHPMLHGLALVQAGGDTAAATALLDAIFDIA